MKSRQWVYYIAIVICFTINELFQASRITQVFRDVCACVCVCVCVCVVRAYMC